MIFNIPEPTEDILTESEIIELLTDNEYGKIFIYKCDYNINKHYAYICEVNLPSYRVGMSKKDSPNSTRYITITASSGSHSGRMKISKIGTKIARNSSNNYISLMYDKGEVKLDKNNKLSPSDIGMDKKEYDSYCDLFERNNDLIQFALIKSADGKYDTEIDFALMDDERVRSDGGIAIRNKDNGSVKYIYSPKNNIVYHDIYGKEISEYDYLHGELK